MIDCMLRYGALFLLLSMPVRGCSEDQVKVGMWDRYEGSVLNRTRYDDPYRDVVLNVTWEAPSGRKMSVPGFYDGQETWKFRFMPVETGTWTYEAWFSDGSGRAGGKILCTGSTNQGMIVPDPVNPNWFGFTGGQHGMVRGFHVGDCFFADNWDDPANECDGNRRSLFLNWLQEQGYNMLSIASHYLNRDQESRGAGWDTPDLWPLDYLEYRKMEAILDDLAGRGIHVYPFAGFFGKSSDFPLVHAEQELYIRYTLARIGAYDNLLYNVAGPEPRASGRNGGESYRFAMSEEDIGRLGQLIMKHDPYGHMITVHNRPNDTMHGSSKWLSFQSLQGAKGTDLDEVYRFLLERHEQGKPTYAQEVFWPGNYLHNDGNPFTRDEIRRKGIVMIMAQSAINFGDMEGNSSSGFSGIPEPDRVHQEWHDLMHRVWDLFDSTAYYLMDPAPDLVSNGFCLANPGNMYMVYLPDGGQVEVALNRDLPFEVTWLDTGNMKDRVPGGITWGKTRFTSPREGEWMLVLQGSPGK